MGLGGGVSARVAGLESRAINAAHVVKQGPLPAFREYTSRAYWAAGLTTLPQTFSRPGLSVRAAVCRSRWRDLPPDPGKAPHLARGHPRSLSEVDLQNTLGAQVHITLNTCIYRAFSSLSGIDIMWFVPPVCDAASLSVMTLLHYYGSRGDDLVADAVCDACSAPMELAMDCARKHIPAAFQGLEDVLEDRRSSIVSIPTDCVQSRGEAVAL